MTEISTGSFPTMGTSAATLSRVGKPERGRMRPRGVAGKGGSNAQQGPTSHRKATFERMGATLHPTATLYAPNAAVATEGQRRVIMMPSRSSWTDNWRSAARRAQTSGVDY